METNVGSRAAVLLVVLQLTYSSAANIPTYFGPNGTLSLSPTNVPDTVTSLLWRLNGNLVAEWIKDAIELQYYSEFVGRTVLDITNGHLEISRATEADSGLFLVEINNKAQAEQYEARMIQYVPDLNVWVKPGPRSDLYVLYCEPVPGKEEVLKAAEPVSYGWKIGAADWVELGHKVEIEVNETTVKAETFTCRVKNPVSEKASEPEPNPFYGQTLPDVVPGAVGGGVGALALVALGGGLVWAKKNNTFPFKRTGDAPGQNADEMEADKLNQPAEPGNGPA